MPQELAEKEIDKAQLRIDELQSCMDAYCNFDGDFFDSADGLKKFKFQPRRAATKEERARRISALRKALTVAKNDRTRISGKRKKLREMAKRGNRLAKKMLERENLKRLALQGTEAGMKGLTQIQSSLQPKVAPQSIVVPAKSNADGYSNSYDLDAENVDIYLGADGDKTTKFPVKPILIGLGVAAVVVAGYFIIKRNK
jgi:hypothetical protein